MSALNKKIILAIRIMVFFALSCSLPETARAEAGGIDVIVMVDTSGSMFPFFDDLIQYLLRDILERRLQPGDNFHLLSFAGFPGPEVSTQVDDALSLEKVIERILLLNALGKYTDLVAAVQYLYNYTKALPEKNKKLVLLLTDGIHDPPPESPNQMDAERVRQELLASAQKIKKEGWNVHILQMPETARPPGSDETKSVLKDFAEALGADVYPYEQDENEILAGRVTGFPTLEFPEDLGRVGRKFKARFVVRNFSGEVISMKLIEVLSDGDNILADEVKIKVRRGQKKAFSVPITLPEEIPEGKHDLPIHLLFADRSLRISPKEGRLIFSYYKSAPAARIWGLYILYLIAALLLLFLIIRLLILLRDRIQRLSTAPFYTNAGGAGKAKYRHRPLIMLVEEQNTNIGSRNIHPVPPGASRSVGGRGSTFLIFYVPVPRRIGDIRNDGNSYNFVPKRREFFPDLTKNLPDCLNKEIQARSKRGHRIVFKFQEYISPLEQINNLMRSIRHAEDEVVSSDPLDRVDKENN